MSSDPATLRPHPGRLRRPERRDQLLDCAAALLVERGVGAVTMEGVAAQAGVSKALPYAHFENASDLVRGLRERELDRVGERITHAVAEVSGLEPTVAAAVHAYFDAMRERGAVLVAALRSLPMDEDEAIQRENPGFFVPLFEAHLGMPPALAQLASAVFIAGVNGAVDAWVSGTMHQAEAERAFVRLVVDGATALAADAASDR